MDEANALFSFLAQATAPENSKYKSEQRYDLIVFVREASMDGAKTIFRKVLSDAGWTYPDIKKIAPVAGNMRLSQAQKLDLADAIRAAAEHGSAIVVFPN